MLLSNLRLDGRLVKLLAHGSIDDLLDLRSHGSDTAKDAICDRLTVTCGCSVVDLHTASSAGHGRTKRALDDLVDVNVELLRLRLRGSKGVMKRVHGNMLHRRSHDRSIQLLGLSLRHLNLLLLLQLGLDILDEVLVLNLVGDFLQSLQVLRLDDSGMLCHILRSSEVDHRGGGVHGLRLSNLLLKSVVLDGSMLTERVHCGADSLARHV